MEHEGRQRLLSSPGFRVVRWTLPWIVLGLVVFAVLGVAGQFRRATDARTASGTVDATVTATATVAAPAPAGTVAVAVAEGVLLRKEPSANGEVIDHLANGIEMAVLEQTDTWLKVRDASGRVGWIRNNESLVEVKKK